MARTAQRRAARLAYSISRLARESDISRSMIYEEIATGPPDRPQDWSAYHRTGRRAWVVAVTATAFPTEHDVAPTDETLTEGNRIIAAIGRDEGAPNSVELDADIEAQAIHGNSSSIGAHASQLRNGPVRHPLYRRLFVRGARPFRARFRTLRDRLPKVLALAGITTMQNIQAHRNES